MADISALIASAAVSSAFSSAIVASLIKVWGDYSAAARKVDADIKLEEIRVELKRDADAQLERLRAELAFERLEREALKEQVRDDHQTLFVKLHEQRSAAMQQVFSSIVDLLTTRSRFFHALETEVEWTNAEELGQSFVQAGRDYERISRLSAILFSPDLEQTLENLNKQLAKINKLAFEGYKAGKTPAQTLEHMHEIDEELIKRTAADVAKEFRAIYGVPQR